MKKLLLLTIASFLIALPAVQAQVIANFEVDALGTQGFLNNGWGPALTGVARAADPTGRGEGVLVVGFDGSLGGNGSFEKSSFSPQDAHSLSIWVFLPSDFPDAGNIVLFGQDNQHWAHNTTTYSGATLPKEKWVNLTFPLYGRWLATPGTFAPYAPNQFGRWGVEIQAGAEFVNDVLFDDLTLEGDEPKMISDFEAAALGLNGWANNGWGSGVAGLERVADPSNAANSVMALSLNSAAGARATLQKDNVNLTLEDHIVAIKLWVPADFPDDILIQIVGQDNIFWGWRPAQIMSSTLAKGQWNEIYYDVLSLFTIDASQFDPYTNLFFAKFILDFDQNTTFTGTVYLDDIAWLGPAAPPTADLISPPITVSAGVDTVLDPFTGKPMYHNVIAWTDISADIGESYNLYYSETGKITDVTAPGVIQISTSIPRGAEEFNHRLFTVNGETKTVYYAMTATGLQDGAVVETPVVDGSSNSGAVTAKTSMLYEIPLLDSFDFLADAYLDEFEDLAKTFTRSVFRTETVGELHGAEWTTASTDLNFKGYIVMDANNMYVGMDVTDDNPTGDGQAWEGDGFDIYGGLYDVRTQTSLFKGSDAPGADQGGYRMGAAINSSDNFQTLGYNPWAPASLSYVQEILDTGYIVEFAVAFEDMDTEFGSSFVPEDGMLLPLKIDVNDHDGADDNPGGGNKRSLQCHCLGVPSNFNDWQRTEAWGAPVIVTKTPLPSAVRPSDGSIPGTFALSHNYPNPFNPNTMLEYEIAHASDVKIVVYDLLGKEITTLVNCKKQAGVYTVKWDGTNNEGVQVANGVYFCKMVTPEFTKIQKMIFLK